MTHVEPDHQWYSSPPYFDDNEENPADVPTGDVYSVFIESDVVTSDDDRIMDLSAQSPSWSRFEDVPVRRSSDERIDCDDIHSDLSNVMTTLTQKADILTSSTDHLKRGGNGLIANSFDSTSSQSLNESLSSALRTCESNATSHSLDMPLPKKKLTNVQLFDVPALSFACPQDYQHSYCSTSNYNDSVESLSDSMSLSSAIDTILTETLAFASQTLSQTIPGLLHECSSSAIQKALQKIQIEYSRFGPRKNLRASDLGSVGGYFRPPVIRTPNSSDRIDDSDSYIMIQSSLVLGKVQDDHIDWMWMDGREVRFSSLPWVERQLVQEWRTYEWTTTANSAQSECVDDLLSIDSLSTAANGRKHSSNADKDECHKKEEGGEQSRLESSALDFGVDDDADDDLRDKQGRGAYEMARTLAPRSLPRPEWESASSCYLCLRIFGPTLHRHHCRRCGHSYCNDHSNDRHRLPHLGYDSEVAERVCGRCKVVLDSRDLEERVAWRLARCRDFLKRSLVPYFETGLDTVEDAAYRLTRAAICLARSIPLGAQAYVAIETVEILRKHGLSGIYGLLLRKEFLAAADLLCRVLEINKKTWPLGVHELSAAIFYALAQHRALRGMKPDTEELIHSLKHDDSCMSDEHDNISSCIVLDSQYAVDCVKAEEDEGPGDIVVWEGTFVKTINDYSESVVDETDIFDPKVENVADLLLIPPPNKVLPTNKHGAYSDRELRFIIGENEKDISSSLKPRSAERTEITEPCNPFQPVCERVPDDILLSLLFYAPLALNFVYAECEVDMQLLAAQQGWRLVYASLYQDHLHSIHAVEDSHGKGSTSADRPASAVFAHDEEKIVCLSIRGTTTIHDVVTDIRAVPVPFPQQEEEENNEYTTDNDFCESDEWTSVFRGKGLALCGMAGAALNLFRENADALVYLARNGYRIRIVGHSLGAGVAALLGILMSHHLEKQRINTSAGKRPTTLLHDDDRVLRVYGYGTPSCVDGRLADYTRAYVTNAILHDDIVPRLTPTSIRNLLKHLLHIRETWVKEHLSDDLHCYQTRAFKVWPTRVRESFTLLKMKSISKAKRLKKSCQNRIGDVKKSYASEKNALDCQYDCNERTSRDDDYDGPCEVCDQDSENTDGGLDIGGDLFFDPMNDDPLNESDDESSLLRSRSNNQESNCIQPERDGDWVPFDEVSSVEPCCDPNFSLPAKENNDESSVCDDEITDTPHILEELPLPRMFIPGKIVHIYTHCGGYKAAFVPRKFKSLRRISVAGNCLSDHMSKSYYEGLLEVKTIRTATHDLPSWVGFDEDSTCACCASLFTWASTSNTDAQAARDKHNCRACGALVCDPCSKKKVPITSVGINIPVRVCDRCYNGWGTLHESKNIKESTTNERNRNSNKIFTKNSRRITVVDELAARLPTL